MLEVMPLEDVLVVQKKPAAILGGGGAVMAADNTWPVVLLGMAVIVMLMLSARRKGVRGAFSFSLSDFNMWYYFFGKGQRYQVRVRSSFAASSVGSNCFVTTTSGEFTADLANKEEDDEGDSLQAADRSNADCVIRNCYDVAKAANCIVGTEMVFIYAHSTSSVFVTSSSRMVGPAGFAAAKFRAGLFMGRVYANSIDERESVLFRESGAPVVSEDGHEDVWDFSAKRQPGRELAGEDFIAEKSAVPEWASQLLEPRLQLERCEIFLPSRILRKNVTDVVYLYPWDAEMKLRLRSKCTHKFPVRREQESCYYSSAVVRGSSHTATLSKNVVKIWENRPSRRVVMAVVPPPRSEMDSHISSLDVDWEKETAFLGSASGLLSLWDLKPGICVSSVRCDRPGSLNALQSSNASTSSDNCGFMMTAGRRQSTEDCGGRICLWDSRILTGPVAAAGSTSMNSLPLDEFKFKGFELVARDCLNTISVHDIRMLKSSRVVSTSPTETRSVRRKKTGVQNLRLDEDDWWDVGDSNLVLQGEDDSSEDAWVMVEQEAVKGSSTAPGILSRCFKAISSALAS